MSIEASSLVDWLRRYCCCSTSNIQTKKNSDAKTSVKPCPVFSSIEDICSQNLELISKYKEMLDEKRFSEALQVSEEINNQPVKNIALRRIALALANEQEERALLIAFDIFDTNYRLSVLAEIVEIIKTNKKNPEDILKNLMFSAIESGNETLIINIIENFSCFVNVKKEAVRTGQTEEEVKKEKIDEFLLTCVEKAVQKGKYELALSFLHYLSDGEMIFDEKKKYRKRAFNIIFDPLVQGDQIDLAIKLIEGFKKIPIPAQNKIGDEQYSHTRLCNPFLMKISDLASKENNFECKRLLNPCSQT